MNDIDLRNQIKGFVCDNMTEYCLERRDWDFEDIDEFYRWNSKIIDKLTQDQLNEAHIIMNMIKQKRLCNMDKESMADFSSSGFCYNKSRKMVIFNER